MNKMKNLKLTAVIALMIIGYTAKAQNIIVKAGLSMADFNMSDNSGAIDQYNNFKKNVHFGVFIDKKLNDLVSYETGLMFDQKGTKQVFSSGGNTTTNLINLAYLNLPITFKIGVPLNEKLRIYGRLGGFGGYGMSGKIDSEVIDSAGTVTSSTTNDIQLGNDATNGDQLKPLDYGATLGAGLLYKKFSLDFDYDMSLANLATDQSVGQNFKNKELKITLGFHFGG